MVKKEGCNGTLKILIVKIQYLQMNPISALINLEGIDMPLNKPSQIGIHLYKRLFVISMKNSDDY